MNWSQFLARNVSGSLKVEPESSILYSSGLVFSRVSDISVRPLSPNSSAPLLTAVCASCPQLLEYEDVNDTAEVTSDLFPPYNLQDLNWARLNLSDTSAVLCGTAANGSFCLRVCHHGDSRSIVGGRGGLSHQSFSLHSWQRMSLRGVVLCGPAFNTLQTPPR